MDAPSQEELTSLQAAGRMPQADTVVHWQSAFGLIIIEIRAGDLFVNGKRVEPFTRDRLPSAEHPGSA